DVARIGGVDEYWALGDLVALGHDPIGVVERLVALPGLATVRGNTDRYVVTGDRPPPTTAAAVADPDLVPVIAEVAGTSGWTAGCMSPAGLLPWLESLPPNFTRTLPDGTRLLAVHASPQSDDGPGIDPRATDDEQAALLEGCGADVVFAGHTHRPVDRQI